MHITNFEFYGVSARQIGNYGRGRNVNQLVKYASSAIHREDLIEMRYWILQANPDVWDVFGWWEEDNEHLTNWVISKRLNDIHPDDKFALWISGKNAGVYAIGEIGSGPKLASPSLGKRWKKKPKGECYEVGLKVSQYFFDQPLYKRDLARERDFADSLIIRMPHGANPIEINAKQWKVISNKSKATGTKPAEAGNNSIPRVVQRLLSTTPESVSVTTPESKSLRTFKEAKLVAMYEKSLGRPLQVYSVRLKDGPMLVCDAYDKVTDTLIEAKSSSSRQDIRMAIGQLFDYQKFLKPGAKLAILLPAAPEKSASDLLSDLGIKILVNKK